MIYAYWPVRSDANDLFLRDVQNICTPSRECFSVTWGKWVSIVHPSCARVINVKQIKQMQVFGIGAVCIYFNFFSKIQRNSNWVWWRWVVHNCAELGWSQAGQNKMQQKPLEGRKPAARDGDALKVDESCAAGNKLTVQTPSLHTFKWVETVVFQVQTASRGKLNAEN